MISRKARIALMLTVLLTGLCQKGVSQGNLLVAPIRVVFENGKQKEDLNLTNIGQDTAIYLMSFIQYRMMSDGRFQTLENVDSVATRADKYLRMFPRKVVLPPGESQTIRMQYRKPADLKEGEYRSHLYFRAEKEVTALGMKPQNVDTTQMSVSITPIFGISIPVIIRNGNLKFQITLSDVSLSAVNDSVSLLSFNINRTGDRSSYGNLRVELVPNKGQTIQIGMANGVGVYTDLNTRRFALNIRNTTGQKLINGKLIIRYSNTQEEGGAELAKIEFRLP